MLRGLKAGGAAAALRTLAAFVTTALLPAVALRGLRDDAPPPSEADADADATSAAAVPGAAATDWVVYLLWINLLLGSGPGLLCHGHAAPMLSMCGAGGGSLGALGVSGMAAGSVIGRMGGGVAIDIFSARRCMFWLPALCAPVVLGPLLAPASVAATFAALVACGLSYGINAVALPVICSRVFGPQKFGAAYGKVFTAWGLGGIVAPWLAGRLYDATGGYRAALIVSSVSRDVGRGGALPAARERRSRDVFYCVSEVPQRSVHTSIVGSQLRRSRVSRPRKSHRPIGADNSLATFTPPCIRE